MKFNNVISIVLNTAVPRRIRMDRGTENIMIEDVQVAFRTGHTDDMAGEKSVIYGSSTHNQVSVIRL